MSCLCSISVLCVGCVLDELDFNAAADLSPIDICDVVRHNLNLPLQIRTRCIAMFHLSLDLTRPKQGKNMKKQISEYFQFLLSSFYKKFGENLSPMRVVSETS